MANRNRSQPQSQILKRDLSSDDVEWKFWVKTLPNLRKMENKSGTDGQKLAVMFITVKQESITLEVKQQKINRVLAASANTPEELIVVSFAGLKFVDQLPRATTDYITRLLTHGIFLNGQQYIFYGHSNSQLKSRTCYLLRASHGDTVMKKLSQFGDFSNFLSVAKRAKRIGLLFSAAEASVQLDPKFTVDIDDVEADGHVFTDGCGMIAKSFANELAKNRRITFANVRYCPSAYQIRYKGYKGMLMLNPNLPQKVHFRASMRKFKDCPDHSFSVLDYSRPFTYACLNGELVTLLSCLGIDDSVFKKKQDEYFKFLETACTDPRTAFTYLCYKGEFEAAEDVLLGGLCEKYVVKVKSLCRQEWKGTYTKTSSEKESEKVKIMIPESRLLYGVCDYTGTLEEGQVHVRITTEARGQLSLTGGQVIVSRNPCLHPGDIRKFCPVRNDRLSHLVDCIVFPTVGQRDAASFMSGGDLDGDRFFVCWDQELIPSRLYEPFGYPPAKETTRRDIDHQSMIQYFARYTNASLGRVKNLYLDWCRAKPNEGAGSKECQQLSSLFSSCVDGERIKVPEHLETPPKITDATPAFILDTLCNNVKKHAETIFRTELESVTLTPREVLEELLSSSDMPSVLDEYRLYLMALRWCAHNGTSIDTFIHYFDFGCFTTPQKHAVLSSLTSQQKNMDLGCLYVGQIFNGMHQSYILGPDELRSANMHHSALRWQKLYSSFDDDGLRLGWNLDRTFEYFERKMLVFQVYSNLKLAIYIPKRIHKFSETDVGNYKDSVKLFAFETESGHWHKTDVLEGYRLYFDGEIFQLFDKRRPNTFLWFALNEAFALRNSIQSGGEFKVSVALNKFNYRLSKSQPRITKRAASGIEIYVISNRDRVGKQENTLNNNVETTEVVPILSNIPKDYNAKDQGSVGADMPILRDLSGLSTFESIQEFKHVFRSLLGTTNQDKLFDILIYIFTDSQNFASRLGLEKYAQLQRLVLGLAQELPSLSLVIVQALTSTPPTFTLPNEGRPDTKHFYDLVAALLLSTNEFHESTLKQLKHLIDFMTSSAPPFSLPELSKLAKFTIYSVRDIKLAQDILDLLLRYDLPQTGVGHKYFRRFLHAMAAEYLAEVVENCPCDVWGLPIGAEQQSDTSSLPVPRNHLESLPRLNEFLPQKLLNPGDSDAPPPRAGRCDVSPPVPHQKCLEISACSADDGTFETILRIDVLSKIRSEDHLRFCASKRAMDKLKSRVTVFDAIAMSIVGGKLVFRILQTQPPPELFAASWNLYICGSTTNLNTMCTALYNLIALREEATYAFFDILEIPNETNGSTNPRQGSGSAGGVTISQTLNESQVRAVQEAVENPLTLVWGPPGAGKTTVVVEIILNFLRLFPGRRILVSASTHNAVDNVMERFLNERKKAGDGDSEDAIRLTSDLSKVSPKLKRWTLDAFVGQSVQTSDKAKGAAAKKLKLANIVFSTCSGAGVGLLRAADDDTSLWPKDLTPARAKKAVKKTLEGRFGIVIVDEASQITEPNAIIPIAKASQHVVLVGDHVQLRPTVSGELAKELGLETSLFEKLYLSQATSASKVMLNMQYRMHPLLCKFPSDQFYESKLLSGVSGANRMLPESKFPWPETKEGVFPFVFIPCQALEDYGSTSKANRGQAAKTLQVVQMLLSGLKSSPPEIVVLTPYTKQVILTKETLKGGGAGHLYVNTIDGFQGRESDIIVFVTVRANRSQSLGFLEDKRRMNVALTRAKLGLVVIGDEETLRGNKMWSAMLNYAKKVDLPNNT